jgi:hypothetical protein
LRAVTEPTKLVVEEKLKKTGDMMDPLMAGLTAWVIELAVAGTMFYGLRREEQKVIQGRQKTKS